MTKIGSANFAGFCLDSHIRIKFLLKKLHAVQQHTYLHTQKWYSYLVEDMHT